MINFVNYIEFIFKNREKKKKEKSYNYNIITIDTIFIIIIEKKQIFDIIITNTSILYYIIK
jgi:hypothetical protein